ncbi:MAG: hypothetical protein LBT79_01815, partial [Elusimicrobiota bacterium]|nr:hypothetical protein [Elusimicrobiota bacterium]
MKKIICLISILFFCAALLEAQKSKNDFSAYKDGSIIKVQIGENTLNLTVAKSDLAKAKGLSNRKE